MGEVSNGAPAPAAAPGQPAPDATEKTPSAIPGAPGAQAGGAGGDPIKAAANAAARKLKIASEDGQEVEVDEAEVIKVYRDRKGHQKAANQKLQEGLKYRKQSEDFVNAMKNPETLVDTLYKMGYTQAQVRQLSEKYLAQVLEDEMMDPKDKELKTTKQRLQEFEKKEQNRKDAEEKQHHEALKKKYAEDYSKEFIAALQTTKLPPTKGNVGKMAGYIAHAAKIKMPMTANEAAKLVQQDIIQENRHLFKDMTSEQIIDVVGEDGLKKIREFDISRIKDPSANLKTPEEQRDFAPRKKEPVKRMSPAEWRAFNRK